MPARSLPESVRRMQASKSMRLRHELWHYSRGVANHPRGAMALSFQNLKLCRADGID